MTASRRPGRARHLGAAIGFAILGSFGAVMTMPRPVVACSCVAFATLKDAISPENAVFTGTAGPRQARGVPVEVDRWFWGRGAAPVVWLAASSFGDSAACGTEPPPPGSTWLWVAWRPDDGDFATGLCSPAGRLDAAEGQAMLREALALFPDTVPIGTDPPAAATPEVAAAPGPADAARDRTAITILGGLIAGTLALFGGLVLVARRTGRADR
jgi:hypothetical protein